MRRVEISKTPIKQKPERERIPYQVIDCPLFQHKKITDVCTVLRAKGVCKVNCITYFEFAQENREAVGKTIQKYRSMIEEHRKRHELKYEPNLLDVVLPVGDQICEHCGKAFKDKGWLERHQTKKHRREITLLQEQQEKNSNGKTQRDVATTVQKRVSAPKRSGAQKAHANSGGAEKTKRTEKERSSQRKTVRPTQTKKQTH